MLGTITTLHRLWTSRVWQLERYRGTPMSGKVPFSLSYLIDTQPYSFPPTLWGFPSLYKQFTLQNEKLWYLSVRCGVWWQARGLLQGSYAILLGVNVVGTCLAWGLFWIFTLENRPGCTLIHPSSLHLFFLPLHSWQRTLFTCVQT